MKAIIYPKPHCWKYQDTPTPQPGPEDVLIRIKSCGVCATDLHIYNGEFISRFPLVPGHEFSGEATKVGDKVEDIKVGDKVTVDNAIYCGNCEFCRNNKEHFCLNFRSIGVTQNGAFAEYVVAHESHVYDIENLSYDEASFTEPLSCAIHGFKLLGVTPGAQILVFGAGATGLMLLQLAKYSDSSLVVIADPNYCKLDKAKELGADFAIFADRSDHVKNREVLLNIAPLGYDYVIDATGKPEVQENCLWLVKKGGKFLVFGLSPNKSTVRMNPYEILIREITIIGSNCQLYDFSAALKLLKAGLIKVRPLITHRFPLEEFGKALEIAQASHEKLKIIINP